MEREPEARGVPFDSQPEQSLQYKDQDLSKTYRLDFICYGKIIVELKVVSWFEPAHKAQVINYPKAKVEGIIL